MSDASEPMSEQHLRPRAACSPTRCGRSSRRSDLGDPGRGHPDGDHRAGRRRALDWAEELSESELRALRDPRNWVRPVAAVGAGGVAAGGARRASSMRRRRPSAAGLAGRPLRASLRGRGGPRPRRVAGLLRRRARPRRREPGEPEDQVQHVVRRVDREEPEDRLAARRAMKPQIASTT